DWPIGYDDLESYYCDAEELMRVAGPSDRSPFPRSRPYPQPPHTLSRPEEILAEAMPEAFFPMPTARPTRNVAGGRPACCAAGVCSHCPIDSKFTISNGLSGPLHDSRVELELGAEVLAVETRGGRATGVVFRQAGAEHTATGELVVLGANGLFNPAILLRSGLDGPQVGRGLVEQTSQRCVVDLDGVDGFQGSSSLTGHGYLFYDGPHRARHAGCLVETSSIPSLRQERGKWRQRLVFKLIFEDLRQEEHNRVELTDDGRPATVFTDHSVYSRDGLAAITRRLDELLAPLPVERVRFSQPADTEAHVLGTTVMGADPATSVVDALCLHHQIRNLLVLGGGTFPTAAPANPTLTICALALRSARELFA
ncbi:MAG: GMC oxidoreductase, partial [Acidobacteriota bacterium]